jgi:hypothetical protein
MSTVVPIKSIATTTTSNVGNSKDLTLNEEVEGGTSSSLPKEWGPTMSTDRGLESKGWMEFAGGFCHNYQDDTKLCVASSICPCLVAALNASELQHNLEHEPKWMARMAALYMLNPCSVGSAIREDIWKLATSTREQRPGSLTHKKSFCTTSRFFCLPHMCCCGGCCCAVAQDRRALISARAAVKAVKTYTPTFRAELLDAPKDLVVTGETGSSKT